jgi:drug/metabolite transporter (DMT)-like permease
MRGVTAWWIIGIYWLLNGLINLLELDITTRFIRSSIRQSIDFYYNLVETPLLLMALAVAVSGRPRRQILLVLSLFIAGEAVIISWKGDSFFSSAALVGSGLLLIITCCITGLLQYMKKMEHTHFENSMLFVYAALLFSYGSYLIIYIFAHLHIYNASGGNGYDSFLLYYISLLLSSAITAMGLWNYGIRRHKTRYSSSSS